MKITTTARRLLANLARMERWASSMELADAMRCAWGTSKASLSRLEQAGLVHRTGRGKRTLWAATEAGVRMVVDAGSARGSLTAPPAPSSTVFPDGLAERLAAWMDEREMGPAAVAAMIGTSQSTVSRWRLGGGTIRESNRAKVEALLMGGGASTRKGK